MSFSSGVRLADLNDHIAPGVACINPAVVAPPSETQQTQQQQYEVAIHSTSDQQQQQQQPATITLNDCLACSGCITSTEAVLVNMQDERVLNDVLERVRQDTNDPNATNEVPVVVVSLSPQSRASLAVHFNMTNTELHLRLSSFFRTLGVRHVYDTAFSRDISLIVGAREFVRRYRVAMNNPVNATTPLLSSSCPGWVCYAEKSQHALVPLIDTTKSPQQIMGSLAKLRLASKYNVPATRIFHATVMPCYDKKLEASRSVFKDSLTGAPDVDCVITTGQLMRMLLEKGITNLATIPALPTFDNEDFIKTVPRSLQQSGNSAVSLARSVGSSSGGYLAYVFRFAAKKVFNVDVTPEDLSPKGTNPAVRRIQGRTSDWVEWVLLIDGVVKLRFAATYGFRNIQNLVRKLGLEDNTPNNGMMGKSSSTATVVRRKQPISSSTGGLPPLQFVEVMACPSGCINGGGQLIMDEDLRLINYNAPGNDESMDVDGNQDTIGNKASTSSAPSVLPKSVLAMVQEKYDSDPMVDPEQDKKVFSVLDEILARGGCMGGVDGPAFTQILADHQSISVVEGGFGSSNSTRKPVKNPISSFLLTEYAKVPPLDANPQPISVGSNW